MGAVVEEKTACFSLFDEEEHLKRLQKARIDVEDVASKVLLVMGHEVTPNTGRSTLVDGRNFMVSQHMGNCLFTEGESSFQ